MPVNRTQDPVRLEELRVKDRGTAGRTRKRGPQEQHCHKSKKFSRCPRKNTAHDYLEPPGPEGFNFARMYKLSDVGDSWDSNTGIIMQQSRKRPQRFFVLFAAGASFWSFTVGGSLTKRRRGECNLNLFWF